MPSNKTSLTKELTIPSGEDYKGYCALVSNGTAPASRVTPVTLVGPSTGPDAGASVSITLASSITPGIPIKVGQWLEFIDPTGAQGSIMAQVVGGATSGADFTTGTDIILKLLEDMPDDAEAIFPPFIDLLETFDQTATTGVNSRSTYDHIRNGTRQVARGDNDSAYTLSGAYSDYSAGQLTLKYARSNSTDIYIERQRANPDANTFTTNPPIEWATGIVTEFSISPADNGPTFSSGVAINGSLNEVDPA